MKTNLNDPCILKQLHELRNRYKAILEDKQFSDDLKEVKKYNAYYLAMTKGRDNIQIFLRDIASNSEGTSIATQFL